MKRNGFALAAVMFILLGAASIAAAAQFAARGDAATGEALARGTELALAIEGATALAAADLIDPSAAGRAPRLDGGRPATYTVGTVRVEVRAVAQAGRININVVEPADLAAMIRSLTGAGDAARNVERAVSDRRAAGRSFLSVTELRPAFGSNGGAFAEVAPFLSTSGSGAPDASSAPEGLRRAWPRPVDPPPANSSSANAPQSLAPGAFPPVSLFFRAVHRGGAVMMEERTVALAEEGALNVLAQRPYDRTIEAALFSQGVGQ
ncbi:hypothetical protein GC169_04235 [bacterium]|nr:hypothetical protein [bacterium]